MVAQPTPEAAATAAARSRRGPSKPDVFMGEASGVEPCVVAGQDHDYESMPAAVEDPLSPNGSTPARVAA